MNKFKERDNLMAVVDAIFDATGTKIPKDANVLDIVDACVIVAVSQLGAILEAEKVDFGNLTEEKKKELLRDSILSRLNTIVGCIDWKDSTKISVEERNITPGKILN